MSSPYPPQPPRRLERSKSNRILGGVCAGVANYLNMDPTLVRVLTVVISLFTGVPVILYIIALFVVPEEGGIIWVTPMEIPKHAEHPTDAHLFLDWFYRPEIAVQVTDWVLYMTPVKGVQELMAQKARESKGGNRRYYETLSRSPLLFPPDDPAEANLHEYHAYDAETFQAWAERFGTVTEA